MGLLVPLWQFRTAADPKSRLCQVAGERDVRHWKFLVALSPLRIVRRPGVPVGFDRFTESAGG
jgi:hypothetical protein